FPMTAEPHSIPPWLTAVLLAKDDAEESGMGSDWHQEAIFEAHSPLLAHAQEREGADAVPWYVSSQVTVIVRLPRRAKPWQPKPDLFVVVGVPPGHRTSYDTRREGPMPQFVLEVASESTWRDDVGKKRNLYEVAGVQEYLVFDPTGQFFAERIHAWRAGEDGWLPWRSVTRADGQSVWHSEVLGLALRVEGSLLRFDHPVTGPLLVRREVVEHWHATQQALEAAEQDLEQERAAREAAEQRARAAVRALSSLEDELRHRCSDQ
ncbi:MAG TPA: Uma2 family endonuclease, partial [Chloroflexota bacterium]|nr:Uma2 family endonuclease [Chloroflexota bacterium]